MASTWICSHHLGLISYLGTCPHSLGITMFLLKIWSDQLVFRGFQYIGLHLELQSPLGVNNLSLVLVSYPWVIHVPVEDFVQRTFPRFHYFGTNPYHFRCRQGTNLPLGARKGLLGKFSTILLDSFNISIFIFFRLSLLKLIGYLRIWPHR